MQRYISNSKQSPLTRQIPRISLADIHFRDDGGGEGASVGLALQVLHHQLFISRVEAKAGRQSKDPIFHKIELLHSQQQPKKRKKEGGKQKQEARN